MKLVLNQGVRDTMAELSKLFDRYDELTRSLASHDTSFTQSLDDGHAKMQTEKLIVSMAARLLSHATRGRRYPNMTEYREF